MLVVLEERKKEPEEHEVRELLFKRSRDSRKAYTLREKLIQNLRHRLSLPSSDKSDSTIDDDCRYGRLMLKQGISMSNRHIITLVVLSAALLTLSVLTLAGRARTRRAYAQAGQSSQEATPQLQQPPVKKAPVCTDQFAKCEFNETILDGAITVEYSDKPVRNRLTQVGGSMGLSGGPLRYEDRPSFDFVMKVIFNKRSGGAFNLLRKRAVLEGGSTVEEANWMATVVYTGYRKTSDTRNGGVTAEFDTATYLDKDGKEITSFGVDDFPSGSPERTIYAEAIRQAKVGGLR